MTAEDPGLLGYLGLLGAAREIGIPEAHQLVTEPDRLPAALDTPDLDLRLALARLGAGQERAGPADHLTHALAALDVDASDEAEWAAERCRSASPTWELPSLLTRLDEYARTHSDRDITPLGPPFSRRRPEPQAPSLRAWRGDSAAPRHQPHKRFAPRRAPQDQRKGSIAQVNVEPGVGLEPTTYRLQGGTSALTVVLTSAFTLRRRPRQVHCPLG